MISQVSCPNCRTPFSADLHQVIDVGVNPELKQLLLSGQLNVAVCPNCGSGGQMATALLFHDPSYEMFVVHVPKELNLTHLDREKLIGELSRRAMNVLPPEQRRAYMLQPQQMFSMQNFMEKVLETEGITAEMINRQRQQADLLRTLATADKDVADHLIKERISDLDQPFFAMLQAHIDAVAKENDNTRLVALTNLRAKLMVETPVGRQLEKQQIAVHALSREAKAQDGLSAQLLLKHILKNVDDEGVVDAVVAAGRSALTYELFSLLTQEMEKWNREGDRPGADRLIEIRERLLKVYDSIQEESKRILSQADETLQAILAAEDRKAAIKTNLSRIDEAFMYLLSSSIAEAEATGDEGLSRALGQIHSAILDQLKSRYPTEVIVLNQLMEADSPEVQRSILDQNQESLLPDLVRMIDNVSKELDPTAQADLNGRLQAIKLMIEARM